MIDTDSTAIFIPTLGRAERFPAIIENIEATTPQPHTIYFIIEPSDVTSFNALRNLPARCIFNENRANYAGAINSGYENTTEDWMFTAADDLRFVAGWLARAQEEYQRSGCPVIGTNDMGNGYVLQGLHATHYLVHRSYLDNEGGVLDEGPGSFMPECYDHNYTDTEFIAVAQMRGKFAPCLDSVVEHLHPAFGKAAMDSTYERGNREYNQDRIIFIERMKRLGVPEWHA